MPGRTRILPAMSASWLGWRGSLIRPVLGSTPPQKLMGLPSLRTSPAAWPAIWVLALECYCHSLSSRRTRPVSAEATQSARLPYITA